MSDARREHPFGTSLALYAGGDLAWKDRFLIACHLFRCPRCSRVVEQSRAIRQGMGDHQGGLPPGLKWDYLAAEMKANIHLGLDAGAIVGSLAPEPEQVPPPAEAAGWRAAIVLASVAVVVAAGWYLNRTQPPVALLDVPVLAWSAQSRAEGLELAERGAALTLLTPARESVRTDAEWGGGLRARYVDSETGQVTVSQVYADAE